MMGSIEPSPEMSSFQISLRLGLGATLSLFTLGMVAGVISVSVEKANFGAGLYVGLGIAVLSGLLSAWMLRSGLRHYRLPRSPKVRRSRIALFASLGISVVLGLAVGIIGQVKGDVDNVGLLFSSAPISVMLAGGAIAGWIVAMAVSVYWHTTLDEIERLEYEFGAAVGMYAYITIAPIWWLAWRGGLLPEPDGVMLFWAACVAWSAGWAWRRYR